MLITMVTQHKNIIKGFAFCKIVTKSNRNPISVILAVTSDLCRKIEGYTKYDLIG